MLSKEKVQKVLENIVDPELGLDIWTLGLVYETKVEGENVWVKLTFTSIACPYGPQMVEEVTEKLKRIGAKDVKIEVTFDPPWKPSEELRAMLGL